MIQSEYQIAFRPCIRDDILLGPPLRAGGKTIFYLKDTFTSWFYRIGVKEHFLISRMDGSRSLQELNDEYLAEFGRPLNEGSWAGLFALLEKRQLLANTADTAKLEDLKRAFAERKKRENRGLLRRRFAFIRPDSILEKLLPWFQFMFSRTFVLPALLCVIALEIFIGFHLTSIVASIWPEQGGIWSYILFIMLVWIFAVIHETAHGLTCKKFGGGVSEMGLVWRYLTIFPYCKIDDVMLFHNRWYRVYAAFAGIFVNFLSLIPFGLFWAFTPVHSLVHTISALMLLSFNLMIFVNFVPFIELDGYFMLSHALNMADLRKEAHQFWQRGLLKIVLKRGSGNVGLSRWDTWVYLIYGFFSLVITGGFLATMAFYWFFLVKYWLGGPIALGLFLLIALVLVYRELGRRKIAPMPQLLQRVLMV
ncbi:MAG TPA: M50 family metallopeptidase [Ktedonobacteraceae bacterium]|nr:M50 family metallopeptidase [Ktedonobacteraceae bacterium]